MWEMAKAHCRLPVVLGSGVDDKNIAEFFPNADGFIIGSHFKREGKWQNEVDARRVEKLVNAARRLRDGVEGA